MAGSKNRTWVEKISDPRVAKSFAALPVKMDGYELSYADKLRVYDAYVGEAVLMLDAAQQLDEVLGLEGMNGFVRDFSTRNLTHMLIAWSKVDVIEWITQYKAVLLCLRDLSSKKGCRNYANYDMWLAAHDVERTSVVVKPLARLLKVIWQTLDWRILKIANSLVQYTVRLTLTDVDWVIEDEIIKYKQDEDRLHAQEYDIALLDEVRAVCRWWLRDFNFENARGQHGYGATAGVKRSAGTTAKYKDFLPTKETAILASWLNWWPEFEFWPGITEKHAEYLYSTDDSELDEVHHNSEQHMKYNTVPKSFNKKRGVSMEPTSHMFMQKMLFGILDDYYNSHPECHIHLHDQERSRKLCLHGSHTNEYATIDLSSASDSVTRHLVEYILQDSILGEALRLCRTEYADITHTDGTVEVVELEKFAPMGSAVCFPIECLVFSSIVTVAEQQLGVDDNYAVYGDDIVCSSRVFDAVVQLLTQLHFQVNTDKSYGHCSDFLEACGMEAYMGHDISPLRMSRKWDVTKLLKKAERNTTSRRGKKPEPDTSTILTSAYDAVNEAASYGFRNLRYLRLKQTLDAYPRAMFSELANMGIQSTHGPAEYMYPVNRMRLNEDLQRVEVLCTVVRSDVGLGEDLMRWSKLAEEYAYTQRSTLLFAEDRIEVKCGAAHTYVKTVWVPLTDLKA